MIKHALRYAACAIWASMGIGKTSAMLYVIQAVLLMYGGPVLIIAPKRVARKTWPDEFEKFDNFKGITYVNIISQQTILTDEPMVDVYVVSYDIIQWFSENVQFGFSLMIIDESTKVKGFRLRKGPKRAKSVLDIRKNTKRVIELSGTPAPNGLMDLWGQLYMLDMGKRLGRSLTAFRERWFISKVRPTHTEYEPQKDAVSGVINKVKDICLPIRSEDYFDLAKLIETDIKIDIPEKAREIYNHLEEEMYAQLESGADIDVVNAADKTLKCLQCTSGALYIGDDRKQWDVVHNEKLEALESIVGEAAGSPVLVCYHFKHEVKRILKKFPQCKFLDKKNKMIDKWNKGELPMLLLHPASAGHGLNLQYGGNIIVFYTQWWDFEQDAQVVERIGPMRQLQAGYERNVFRYNIIAENTVDEKVKKVREYKLSIDQALKREVV